MFIERKSDEVDSCQNRNLKLSGSKRVERCFARRTNCIVYLLYMYMHLVFWTTPTVFLCACSWLTWLIFLEAYLINCWIFSVLRFIDQVNMCCHYSTGSACSIGMQKNNREIAWVERSAGPSCSISHKISKSDSSGGEPCNLWFCATHNMGGL